MKHHVNDGLGLRDVFVDGKRVEGVVFADTVKGIVRCYRQPLKVDKHHKRLLTKTIRGVVTVTFIEFKELKDV